MLQKPSLLNAELHHVLREAVLEDKSLGAFKVNRRVFTDEAVLETEIAKPGSFITRRVGGRPLILNRDRTGKLHAFFNTCSHRGALVCRERQGLRRSFQCPYHGWVYDDRGVLVDVPGSESMAPGLVESGEMNLVEVPKLGEYRGFVFINYDPEAMSLEHYLADAKAVLDLVSEQGEIGMEVVGGTQEYAVNANWKLLQENSADGYHAATTHSTYLDYIASRDGMSENTRRMADPAATR